MSAPGRYCLARCYCGECPGYRPPPTAEESAAASAIFRRFLELRLELAGYRRARPWRQKGN